MTTTKMIPLRQVAALTGLSHATLYRLLKNHELPGARKISGAWFFDEVQLDAFFRGEDPNTPASDDTADTASTADAADAAIDTTTDLDPHIQTLAAALRDDPTEPHQPPAPSPAPTPDLAGAHLALQRAEVDTAAAHERADAAMRQLEHRSQLCLDLQAERDRLGAQLRELEGLFALVDPRQRLARSIAQATDAEFRAAAADHRARKAEESLAAAAQRITELEARLAEADAALLKINDRATHAEAWAADAEKRVALAEDRLAALELEALLTDSDRRSHSVDDPAADLPALQHDLAAALARAEAAEAALTAEKRRTAELTASEAAHTAVINTWATALLTASRAAPPHSSAAPEPSTPALFAEIIDTGLRLWTRYERHLADRG